MITVRVVQVAIDEVVDVIAVRHCLVAATRTMHVICLVTAAVVRPPTLRIRFADRVVQVADVIAVLNSGVTATGSVLVVVVSVLLAAHESSPFRVLRWVGSAWSITLAIRSRTWLSASE